MKKLFFPLLASLMLAVSVWAEPIDYYSLTHSTYIADTSTWSGVSLPTTTIHAGDMLAYITVASTGTGSVVTIYDGADTNGTVRAEVLAHEMGVFPFDVRLSSASGPSGYGQVTISKTGTSRIGITFYTNHPIY